MGPKGPQGAAGAAGAVGPQGPQGPSSMSDGTATAPGLPFAANTATGFYRPAANTLGFVTASVERMRIDSSGNVTGATITNPTLTLQSENVSPFSGRNRIINGAMVIDQRNAGSAYTGVYNIQYTLDRWVASVSQSSKMTVQQNAGSVTPPAGFTNYLGITVASAVTPLSATDYFQMMQRIEGFNVADLGWGTANAQTVTLSFWVRSNLIGTYGGALENLDQSRNYVFSYTINSANTWEQKSITVPGDTTGTWNKTNGIGLWLNLGLGTGTFYSGTAGSWTNPTVVNVTGNTNLMASTSNSWYITGVQLERGTVATPFEWRPFGQELALCQRYARTVTDQMNLGGASTGGTTVNNRFAFPVTMRAAPTTSIITAGSWIVGNDYSANYTASSVSIGGQSLTAGGGRIVMSGFSSLPAAGILLAGSDATGTAVMLLSAEL